VDFKNPGLSKTFKIPRNIFALSTAINKTKFYKE
jgi:hypothetical protein